MSARALLALLLGGALTAGCAPPRELQTNCFAFVAGEGPCRFTPTIVTGVPGDAR